jgi:hypothetical protein
MFLGRWCANVYCFNIYLCKGEDSSNIILLVMWYNEILLGDVTNKVHIHNQPEKICVNVLIVVVTTNRIDDHIRLCLRILKKRIHYTVSLSLSLSSMMMYARVCDTLPTKCRYNPEPTTIPNPQGVVVSGPLNGARTFIERRMKKCIRCDKKRTVF